MRFGVHLSTSGGLRKTARLAVESTCDTFQIFSGNPMGWRLSKLKEEDVEVFKAMVKEHDIRPIFLHTPYLVNLAGPDPVILGKSMASVANALEKAAALEAGYIVTHVGSHRGQGVERGIQTLTGALSRLLAQSSPEVSILLEGGTGAGTEIGASLEEMSRILGSLPHFEGRLGICLDTAHLWAVGYDLSTPEGMEETFYRFHRTIGVERLGVIHANDNARALGSHTDYHEIPGRGLIGLESFRALVNLPILADVPCILEEADGTPEERRGNLNLMRGLMERDGA